MKASNDSCFSGMPSRRSVLQGLGAGAATMAAFRPALAAETELKAWVASGQRWEFANRGVAPLFEAANPDVSVKITSTPIANYGSKVAAAMAGGSTEWDVIQLDYAQVPQFAPAGWVEALGSRIESEPSFQESLSDIPERVLDLYRFDGKLYGIPADSNAMLSYYRADVLDRLGVAPPETWDDVLEISRELHSDKAEQYGFVGSLGRGLYAYLGLLPVLWSYGGELWDESTFEIRIDKGDAGYKALTMLRELIKYGDPVSVNASDDEVNSSMSSGTAILAPSAWGNTVMTNPEFSKFSDEIKTAVVPSGERGLRVPAMGGLGHMVVARSRKKDLAWDYVSFVTSSDADVGEAWVRNTGQPARLSLLTRPDLVALHPHFPTLAESLKIARPYGGGIPEAYAIGDVIGTAVSSIITGQIEIEPGLKKIGDDTFAFLQANGYPATR
jgi:multiple sugar transport system substrate-binding protein